MTYRNMIVWLVIGLATIFSFDYFVLAAPDSDRTVIEDLHFMEATDQARLEATPRTFPTPQNEQLRPISEKLAALNAKFESINHKAATLVAQRAIAAGPQMQIVPKEGHEVVIIIRLSDQKAIIEWREEPKDDPQEERS